MEHYGHLQGGTDANYNTSRKASSKICMHATPANSPNSCHAKNTFPPPPPVVLKSFMHARYHGSACIHLLIDVGIVNMHQRVEGIYFGEIMEHFV